MTRTSSTTWWILLLLHLATISSLQEEDAESQRKDIPHRIPGVYHDLLPDQPTFYTEYIPLLFEVPRPEWNDLNFHRALETQCALPENVPDKTCSVFKYLQQVMKDLSFILNMEISGSVDGTNSGQNSPRSIPPVDCAGIVPHFSHVGKHSPGLDLDAYAIMLGSCSEVVAKSLYRSPVIPRDNISSLEPFFEDMLKVEKNQGNLPTDSYTSLQALYLGSAIIENERWTRAFAACEAYNIPQTLIDKQDLEDALKAVNDSLPKTFLLPSYDLSTLFDLQITDCVFTTKGTFLVRVLLPIERLAQIRDYRVYALESVPGFYKVKSTARDISHKICDITNIPQKTAYLLNGKDGGLHPLKCQDQSEGHPHETLCHLAWPDDTAREHPLYCAKYADLMAGNAPPETVMAYCKSHIRCSDFPVNDFPFFKKVRGDTLFVSMGVDTPPNYALSVHCAPINGTGGAKLQEFSVTSTEFLITLPCFCVLRSNKKDVFVSGAPCRMDNNVSVTAVQPRELPREILEPRMEPNETLALLMEMRGKLGEMEGTVEKVRHQSGHWRFIYVTFFLALAAGICYVGFKKGWRFWTWRQPRNSYVRCSREKMMEEPQQEVEL